jgi:hypothetical protein
MVFASLLLWFFASHFILAVSPVETLFQITSFLDYSTSFPPPTRQYFAEFHAGLLCILPRRGKRRHFSCFCAWGFWYLFRAYNNAYRSPSYFPRFFAFFDIVA